MKVGDLVAIKWPDGLEVLARYVAEDRGYLVFRDLEGNRVVASMGAVEIIPQRTEKPLRNP